MTCCLLVQLVSVQSFVTVFEIPWKQTSFCKSSVTTTNLEIQKLAGLVFHSNSQVLDSGHFAASVLEDSSGKS